MKKENKAEEIHHGGTEGAEAGQVGGYEMARNAAARNAAEDADLVVFRAEVGSTPSPVLVEHGPFEGVLIRDERKRPLVMVWLPVDVALLAHIAEQAPKYSTVEGFKVRSLVSEEPGHG